MSRLKATLTGAALCLALLALAPALASAGPAPAWSMRIFPTPANFEPGKAAEYLAIATNVGAQGTAGTSTVKVTLPAGLTPLTAEGKNFDPSATEEPTCSIAGQEVTCETDKAVGPGRRLMVKVTVSVSAPEGTLVTTASASGGGAASGNEASFPTAIQAEPLGFQFLPGFAAPLTEEDGTAASIAGSHPYQQTVRFAFPTRRFGNVITNDGHPRDFTVDLPRGLVGDPAATPVLCTEAQLTDDEGCPKESQVGTSEVTSLLGEAGVNVVFTDNLYNMVPPPGAVAELATDINVAGIYLHVKIGVRSDGDYGVQATVNDVLALGQQPIFGVQSQIWGDPSAKAHDGMRGDCVQAVLPNCDVEAAKVPLLTLPADCPQAPLPFSIGADSWEEPGVEHSASYASADLAGNPTEVEECGALEFEPKIAAQPTTNLTDSPSGLDFQLHQRQDTELAPARGTAPLRDITLTLPPGLVVNPSASAGLGACSQGEVGFAGTEGGALRFSKAPQSCPDAAKLGTVEVTSPALVRRNPETHEVEEQEEEPVLEALHGSLYLAKPFANPFGSLIALYLVIEDERTGIVAKLAGKAELNPQTGQISTRFEENPQLPLEDLKAHIFGGPRGSLTTPPVCATHTTTAQMTPWSAPEGKDVSESASFQSTAAPSGGACPGSEGALPNSPKLSAGTLAPNAGKYSPLLFKVSREDGTQRLGVIETTLPTGLSAKLAGVAQCSDADIAKARSREAPEQGALEQADPSCPAASEIGVANAAAGSGPTPYYTQGHVYLAGPYKGAPLSAVAIAPAVAGPFDLGTVVVRSALYLDPTTAQVRIVTDPLPQILDGVPIDLRSVAVRAERPGFSLNPTSCDEKAFGGQVGSPLGQFAPISERFQAGGCKSLPYKPKLTAALKGPIHRGGHPSFRAVLTAKPGEANTAALSVTLPHSEFIDQAHFRTICTRVQFAAGQCPAGSVYGFVKARSPLVDYTLEGPIYLRSSSHKLPDAVAALRGPASQPIEIDAVARIDSVNGGLRSRVETVPDAPISKVIVSLQGGKKGLFQNSTNICKGTHRMKVSFTGQNAKVSNTEPPLKAKCPKGKGKGKGAGKKGGAKKH